mgnify:CR=1 FL=1|jgi:hypothetical protein
MSEYGEEIVMSSIEPVGIIKKSRKIRNDSSFYYPPKGIPIVGAVLSFLSFLLFFTPVNVLGYIIGMAASILAVAALFVDRSRQQTSRYSSKKWFNPTVSVVYVSSMLFVILHIGRFAYHAAK